jgi:hypothetical protein
MCDCEDDPESIKALEEIQIRVLLLDELAALSDYTRAFGMERGIQQRVDDLKQILRHSQYGGQ